MSMTDNLPAVIDAADFAVRRSILIAAPIDKVWQAVTQPEHISRWFGTTELDGSDVGATGRMTFGSNDPIPLRIEAIDEPHSVSYCWSNDDALGTHPTEVDDATATVFTFTLEVVGDSTRLTVLETGFDRTSAPAENMRSHVDGWTSELDKLVALLESGS